LDVASVEIHAGSVARTPVSPLRIDARLYTKFVFNLQIPGFDYQDPLLDNVYHIF
jgi:hypothetical protein